MQEVIIYRNPAEAAFWADPIASLGFIGMVIGALIFGFGTYAIAHDLLTHLKRRLTKEQPRLNRFYSTRRSWVDTVAALIGAAVAIGSLYVFIHLAV